MVEGRLSLTSMQPQVDGEPYVQTPEIFSVPWFPHHLSASVGEHAAYLFSITQYLGLQGHHRPSFSEPSPETLFAWSPGKQEGPKESSPFHVFLIWHPLGLFDSLLASPPAWPKTVAWVGVDFGNGGKRSRLSHLISSTKAALMIRQSICQFLILWEECNKYTLFDCE